MQVSNVYLLILAKKYLVIVFLQAKEAVRGGDIASARDSAKNAHYCYIASIVGAVITYTCLVLLTLAIILGTSSTD